MELTGMDVHDLLLPLAEKTMRLYREGNLDEAQRAGEAFWTQVPQPPTTDGERLASQLSLMIARRAVPVDRAEARIWIGRARDAYGAESAPGVAMCDFVEATILFAENRLPEARTLFARAVDVIGPKAFADSDPEYKAFYFGEGDTPPVGGTAEELAERGEALSDAGRFAEAVAVWRQALAVTDPEDRDTFLWLHASIGDAQFLLGNHREAYDSMQEALKTGGNENPFVWLRLGQAAFELGLAKPATDALLSAYMLEGDEIFEDEDPKYRQSLVDQGLIS